MLADYVEWHMHAVWSPLLFKYEEKELKKTQNPVSQAHRFASTSRHGTTVARMGSLSATFSAQYLPNPLEPV